MSKMFSFYKISFCLFCIVFFTVSGLGQGNYLREDLSKSLKKYDLIRVSDAPAYESSPNGKTLSVQAAGNNFLLNLRPRNLRSVRYRAEETGASGKRAVQMKNINTFAGEIVGEDDSQVRLTIDNGKIEGYFISKQGKFYIEPAQKFSGFAEAGESVVYLAEDLIGDKNYTCQSDIEERIERGKKIVAEQNFNALGGFAVLEIATEADFEFTGALGGSAQANADILSTLNMVEGVYERELDITFDVVYQHTWTTQDPYPQTNAQEVLGAFKTYWNANFPVTQFPRDAAHLWTAKQTLTGMGRAYLGVVCGNTGASYSLHGRINFSPIDELLTAHEIGHNFNATHAEGAQSCESSIMNGFVTNNTNFSFCPFSRGEITSYVASNNTCLAERNLNAKFDFDGDNRADLSIFRPSNGVWYISNSGGGFNVFQFGQNGDKPVPGDYDGDGKTDAAVFRNGVWFRLRSSDNTFDAVNFGVATDIPAPGDFDGDSTTDLAVFRPSTGTWFVLNSGNAAVMVTQFGANGDVPLAADYDGDNRADINVWRPSNGVWYRINSANNTFNIRDFGTPGDKPLIGDFDGDGKSDLAVFRESAGTFFSLNSINSGFNVVPFGNPGDEPVPADYDGDGKTDVAVFRPSNGIWYRLNSSNGGFTAIQFGIGTDIPAPSYYNK